MITLQKQIINDINGNAVAVLLPIKEYENMIEQIEDLEDIIAYDKAKSQPSDTISLEDFMKELEKDQPT